MEMINDPMIVEMIIFDFLALQLILYILLPILLGSKQISMY